MMNPKQQFGQFFTTNTDYILQNLEKYVANKDVCDPFAGGGDLLKFAKKHGARSVIGFDCDKNLVDNDLVYYNDSLKNPKKYKFVLTNPPYLYQNKLQDNSILKNSKHTDLYQLALEKIMDSEEGIVIVPINFLSAKNAKYIRNEFLEKFEIEKVNYFTNQVFDDTTYNVMAFYYKLKEKPQQMNNVCFDIYPEKKHIILSLFRQYDWQIGGEFIHEINQFKNRLQIKRLEENDLCVGDCCIKTAYNHLDMFKEFKVDKNLFNRIKKNIILLKAIDTGTDAGKICLEDIRRYDLDALVSIKTSRNQIYLIFPDYVSIEEQKCLIKLFNEELDAKREEYFSLFMTNYRDNNRKRISFDFAYNFINYLYFSKIKGTNGVKIQPTLF